MSIWLVLVWWATASLNAVFAAYIPNDKIRTAVYFAAFALPLIGMALGMDNKVDGI